MASTRRPSGRSMPTRTSPCWDQRTRCLVSSSKPCCEWATVARPQILPAGSTTQTSWDSAAQSMPTNIRPPFDRGAVPVAEARGGSLLTGARGASSHGRSALPEAGGGGGISLALEGRWHPALPPPGTEMLRGCPLERADPGTWEAVGDTAVRARILGSAALFVLGFATVFTGLGASASLLGSVLLTNRLLLIRVAGVFVIAMGLVTMG